MVIYEASEENMIEPQKRKLIGQHGEDGCVLKAMHKTYIRMPLRYGNLPSCLLQALAGVDAECAI